jgi:hypothetical protein
VGLSYLKNKKWEDITREERFFCSHLYHSIINREKKFIEWLNNNTTLKLKPNANWEIGYEVCFYRDLIHHWKDDVKRMAKIKNPKQYSPKRTFDLCLFSNDHIVIIEAKAQQGFHGDQLKEFENDKEDIKSLLVKEDLKIDVVLLHSSEYHPRDKRIKKYESITWIDIYNSFEKNNIFKHADELKKRKPFK